MEPRAEPEKTASPRKKTGCVIAGIVIGVVILLGIGILLVMAFFFVRKSPILNPDEHRAAADLQMFEASLIRYKILSRNYPTNAQGLDALVRKPTKPPVPEEWKQLIEAPGLVDPWGQPYHYRCPGVRNPDGYDLWSAGPDGENGTADDIFAD